MKLPKIYFLVVYREPSPTFLGPAQMQHQQVGDAFVLCEGQAERWFGLGSRLSVAVHTVDMSVSSIGVPVNTVHTIHSVRDGVSCKDKVCIG